MIARRCARTGVTFMEVLIVISVLATLFSLVAPALSGGRRTAQRVTCMTKLCELARGAVQYAIDNDDWIIGSPSGSGAYLRDKPVAYGPAVQTWDFLGPTAHMWQMGLPAAYGQEQDVMRRFNALRGHKAFLCPANDFQTAAYSGPDAGAGPMVSYNTIRTQLWRQDEAPPHEEELPPNWRPSVSRIGIASNKVFCADGSRYATVTQPPDYDLTVNAPYGGAFADTGVYSIYTRSWDRSRVPGNGYHGPTDARKYAFRHSLAEPPVGAPGNAYKLNLAFYDGHVETQGDLEASNPHQWLPMGTTLDRSACWPDTIAHFGLPHTIAIAP